jgi:hypothetical protein
VPASQNWLAPPGQSLSAQQARLGEHRHAPPSQYEPLAQSELLQHVPAPMHCPLHSRSPLRQSQVPASQNDSAPSAPRQSEGVQQVVVGSMQLLVVAQTICPSGHTQALLEHSAPAVGQSIGRQHCDAAGIQAPMQSCCDIGQLHIMVLSQVSPPVHSVLSQQSPLGMQLPEESQIRSFGGHWQSPASQN